MQKRWHENDGIMTKEHIYASVIKMLKLIGLSMYVCICVCVFVSDK